MDITDKTIALLIDSDNLSKNYFKTLMEELNQFGRVTYKRLYGDLTSERAKGWRELLLPFGITPIQQYAYVKGKNATDSAMIIDAMDILYSKKVDCFCLATSDSDFTRLATRFKEENLVVIGAGEKKTPQSFRDACDRFLLMDLLSSAASGTAAKKTVKKPKVEAEKPASGKTAPPMTISADIAPLEAEASEEENILELDGLIAAVARIIEANAEEDGWANYSAMMTELYKKHNDFNPKNYGSDRRAKNFFAEMEGHPFEFKQKGTGVLIRNRKGGKKA